MTLLTKEMKDSIASQLNMVVTADIAGNPQAGPKGSIRVLNDKQIIYNESTGKQAWNNIISTGKLAITSVDRKKLKGYRFEGEVEYFQKGQQFKEAKNFAKNKHISQPIAAVVLTIERIYDIGVGAHSGDLIA
jgi:predicted pyridoxine 5'-phosphate oxidase superfamily flavin-nucleotide-binding protein